MSRFFAGKLTRRQILTGCAVAVAAAVSVWVWAGGLAGRSSTANEGGDVESESSRRLLVLVDRLNQFAGPELWQEYTAIVVPRRTSQLAAKALGRVESVLVDVGDAVQSGQLLIQLDQEQLAADVEVARSNLLVAQNVLDELNAGPRRQDIRQAQARVDEIEASLKFSQSNLARISALREVRSVSEQNLDDAQSSYDALVARLVAASKQLELLQEGTRQEQIAAQEAQVASMQASVKSLEVRLRDQQVVAPYNGIIQERLVDEGDVLQPGQPLLELVESDSIELQVGLPAEARFSPERIGASRICVVRSSPGMNDAHTQWPVIVDRVAPAVDARTRTRKFIFRLDDSDRSRYADVFEIGESVTLKIKLSDVDTASGQLPSAIRDAHWVPTRALVDGPRGLRMLYAVSMLEKHGEATVEQRPVELVAVRGDWALVRGPLVDEEMIVTEGVHRIVAGQIVRVRESENAVATAKPRVTN